MLNKIHNENCHETIDRMEWEFLDLTITSPNYNLGKKHHTGNKIFNAYDVCNDNIPEKEYQKEQKDVLTKLYCKTKKTGSLLYNHKNRIINGKQITPYEWILNTPWIVKQEIVWFNGSQNFDKIRFYPMTERIYWLVKDEKTVLKNVINHHDLFMSEWNPVGTDKIHKRSFPESMANDLINCFPDAKIIYDPYSGSGTVAKMAIKNNRQYIGSEISKEYCKISQKRIKMFTDQGRFF